jgi:hypothetical protein
LLGGARSQRSKVAWQNVDRISSVNQTKSIKHGRPLIAHEPFRKNKQKQGIAAVFAPIVGKALALFFGQTLAINELEESPLGSIDASVRTAKRSGCVQSARTEKG